ncbi:3-hydroxyacyl-CoA dehydrogenase NAD-binding domain-containing protein [Paraburkholderia sediminicola]|uniref:3-hydroxyacyl-CoA dehydrogenase NAD-binding domain-containing protein n=1 Tax=Paraburkholderia rhynchosiae TaxID=487049 RepID=A0ACC7NHQ0_9BURK
MIGAGTMGSGIAICALDAGLQVTLVEQDAGALTAGRERSLKHYARKLNADDAAERERRLVCTTDWQSLTHAPRTSVKKPIRAWPLLLIPNGTLDPDAVDRSIEPTICVAPAARPRTLISPGRPCGTPYPG